MSHHDIPAISEAEIAQGILQAGNSERRRHATVLHAPGAEFNQVFNFLLGDTYMQPHLHPGAEKIEEISLLEGRLLMLFFDDQGTVSETVVMEKGDFIRVPAFAWHTYVILSERAVTYETMMGVYDPKTWKEFAPWGPVEGSQNALPYASSLKFRAIS